MAVNVRITKPMVDGPRSRAGLLERIGNTPLIRLKHIASHLPDSVEIYAKAEWYNPGGSVKDRPAAEILRQGLIGGRLDGGQVLLDSTSGNMGISYSTLGAALGVQVSLAIPANVSRQRLQILRALGAELTLTDPLEGTDGAREAAAGIAASHPGRFFYADQYNNPANWQAHYRTTGPEIDTQTEGRITHFVAGLGTTGTLVGTGRYLKQTVPGVRLVAVQPDGPLHGIEGLKHLPTSPTPGIFDAALPDEVLEVRTEEAYDMCRRLAREEGLLAGVSAAAAACAALEVASTLESAVVVALFPDSALKYLDEPFWSQG